MIDRLSRARPCLCQAPHLIVVALCAVVASTPTMAEQDTAALSVITIQGGQSTDLARPASTGSNLGLTLAQTPASVDLITREQIEERGDATVNDAVTRAAGISALPHPGNGFSALSARGFTDSASVMRLYDGTRLYGGVGVTFPFDTWSVERIEVLRGPASVIYGDGAIGGVVNVIPRKPSEGPVENEIQASLGTDNTQRLGLGSGGAISERISYRVDLSGNRSDGWVDRGESSDATFSGALQLRATDELTLKLSHSYGYQRPLGYFGVPLVNGEAPEALRRKNYNVDDGFLRFRDHWTELAARWTPDDATTVRARLYRIGSKRDWRNAEYYDYNPASGLVDRSGNTQISHHQTQTGMTVDAAFQGLLAGGDHRFSMGFDLNRSRFRHSNNSYAGSSGPVDLYDPQPGFYETDHAFIPRYRNKAEQYALFMESRLALTPQWALVTGLRYDHARVLRHDLVSDSSDFSRSFSDVGWRLGAVYELTPDLSLYAQYAKAADPVGGLLMLSPANAAFDMSQGRQLELGLKQAFAQGRGEWTLAAYQIRKTNLVTRDALDPSRSVQVGERSSRGVEATLLLAFARNWRLEANASVLRAQFDDFHESSGGVAVSRSGKVPPNVPERLANLWLSWNFQPGWTAMAGLRYVGKRYADNANTLVLPAYTTTDLALRWQTGPDTTLTARGYNVFDKAYFATAYYSPTQWLYGPGRRFELTLNHRF